MRGNRTHQEKTRRRNRNAAAIRPAGLNGGCLERKMRAKERPLLIDCSKGR